MTAPNWHQRRLSQLCRGCPVAPDGDGAGGDGISHDSAHGRLIPAQTPTGALNLLGHELFGEAYHTLSLVLVASKQLCSHCRLGWFQPHPCWITRPRRIHAVAIGRMRPGQQTSRLVLLLSSPSHAFSNQTAFIFGDSSTNLSQQLIVGIMTHGLIDKLDVATPTFEFLNQEHLMHIIAG